MENADKLKVVAALLLVAVGVAGFYLLPGQQGAFVRSLPVVVGVGLGAAVLWFSGPGRQFADYARESIKEAQKVVWPSKKETWQITGVVFVFVLTLSLFMWAVDSGLTWLLYDVLLGRGK